MYTLFVVFIVVAALLMIGIVLIQESKGGGLASQFSGYNQIGGVRKTTDFIEKTTWGSTGSVMENYEVPATNPNNLPGFGASQQKDAAAPAAAPAAPAAEAPAAPAAEAPAAPAAEAPAAPAQPAK